SPLRAGWTGGAGEGFPTFASLVFFARRTEPGKVPPPSAQERNGTSIYVFRTARWATRCCKRRTHGCNPAAPGAACLHLRRISAEANRHSGVCRNALERKKHMAGPLFEVLPHPLVHACRHARLRKGDLS